MSAQKVTIYTIIEQYMSLFEVQEAVEDVSLERDGLSAVTRIQLRVHDIEKDAIDLRLRKAKSGRGYILEQRSHGGWNRWHGLDPYQSQTAGVNDLFKLAVQKSGFNPEKLPEVNSGFVSRSTQGGKPA